MLLPLFQRLFRRPPRPAGAWREATVFAAGLHGFTPIAAISPHAEPIDWTGLVLSTVASYGGKAHTFSGDDVYCEFASAMPAVEAARAIVAAFDTQRVTGSRIAARIGIATGGFFEGDVIVPGGGRISALSGGPVNVANSLLEHCAKSRVSILMCPRTAKEVSARFDAQSVTPASDGGSADAAAYEPVAR